MTITFNCPQCKCLCAFKDIYAGRRAKCLQCNQVFIIPDVDNVPVKKIKPPKEHYEPLPGFFEVFFKYSLRAIFNFKSIPLLAFVIFVTIVKFYTFHLNFEIHFNCNSGGTIFIPLPIGYILAAFIWGGIFRCYEEIVCSTAFDIEVLPEITFGGFLGYTATVFKSLYSFAIALIMALLPAIIFRYVFNYMGVHSRWTIFPFVATGMFLFPMAVMIISISGDLVLLARPVTFFKPIIKAFRPYLFLAVFFIIAWYLQYAGPYYGKVKSCATNVIYWNMFLAIAVQFFTIFAMRAAGLFYRHFACYFGW